MLIFIGGIHGSGKGTLCEKLSLECDMPHFSASSLLKWEEVSPDIRNKKIEDISDTQNRLIIGLNLVKTTYTSLILDGHFCLFNKDGDAEKVELEIFKGISPDLIVFVRASLQEIQRRLFNRDEVIYSFEELNSLQDLEEEYSKNVAEKLRVPYFQYTESNYKELLQIIPKPL